MNKKYLVKIYSKQVGMTLENLKQFMPKYEERTDISKLRKIWNILTFRKYKNYKKVEKVYRVVKANKPTIFLGDDKE